MELIAEQEAPRAPVDWYASATPPGGGAADPARLVEHQPPDATAVIVRRPAMREP